MCTLILLLTVNLLADAEATLLKQFRSEFIEITPGKGKYPKQFDFGVAPTARRVTMTRHYDIAKYEVTQGLWQAVMGNNPSRWKGSRNSVEMISLKEARLFCKRITNRLREADLIGPTQVIRLPTEMEWEYATRAGTTSAYSFGDEVSKLDEFAWSTQNAAGNDPPVGAKKPNPWGLYDVHGYLWEWCEPAANEKEKLEFGVIRGGSWKDRAKQLTSASARRVAAQLRDDAVGFRCVLVEETSIGLTSQND